MTPSEKAQETRKLHRQSQKAKEEEAREIRSKLINGCLLVLDNQFISATERLEALKILYSLTKER